MIEYNASYVIYKYLQYLQLKDLDVILYEEGHYISYEFSKV